MFETAPSVLDIGQDAWDRLANPAGSPFNPFVSFAFFSALERSGSATPETGWAGAHLVERSGPEITGLVPCYLKSHSQGEYVFDHAWADAFRRAGGRYYPKLQVSVPFTPVTGPRLMGDNARLAAGLVTLSEQLPASSVHITFTPPLSLPKRFVERTDIQFHFHNPGFTSFDDFLKSLSSQKRKNIRKERDSVRALGIECECLTGSDLREEHWDAFFAFYMDTGSRKWGRPYLNRAFFSMIGESLSPNIVLVIARRSGRMIAGALNFIGGDALYGRNWGAIEHHPNLHFEACYYQAIEWAIAHRLPRVEAGAQGPHKLARGYLPVTTRSYHYLAHPGLRRAVEDYLAAEREAVVSEQEALATHSPFRQEQDF